MKTTIKYPALLLIVCFTIWACTKKVETIISIDYEINEDFEGEGFVNSPLPTTVNIVPIQVLEGFDYFIKYEVVSGNGFYSSGSGIIAPNEFMPLTGLNFTANYIPSSQGTHTVKFTIRDEVGLEESTTLTYVISNLNLDWVAITNVGQAGIGQEIPITLTLANNTEGSTATFTRTVRLISGTATLSNSDGAVALNTKAGITPGTYNFTALASETGTLTIEFELEDSSGQTKTARVNIDIITEPVNQAPTAVAGADITNGTAPLTVRFDGSGSTDPEEGTLTYSWTLTNESGTFNETLTGVSQTYEFATPGTYTATLTVTDDEGATGTDTIEITVSESDNAAPTASASADVLSGPAPLTVNFDGSGSSDEDGTIASYSWELSNGVTLSGMSPEEYTFDTPGEYTATLTVMDNDGATATDTIEITVSEPEPENRAPVANDDVATIIEGETLKMNVLVNDTDADGDVLSIDMSRSSTLNGTTVDNGNNEITYTPPNGFSGTAIFDYTVTDGKGGTDTAVLTITVLKAPVANASANVNVSTVRFSSSWDGNDEEATHLTYLWNFGDGNTSTLANPTHTYNSVRSYNVTLTITDRQERRYEDEVSVFIQRLTHFDETTGRYTAPAGSRFTVKVDLKHNGTNAEVTVWFETNLSKEIIEFLPKDQGNVVSKTFTTLMPADSNNFRFLAFYDSIDGFTGGCDVTIIHQSEEERTFRVSSYQPYMPEPIIIPVN